MNIDTGRCALVTGAASGLGFEIARRLNEAGVAVALVDMDEKRLEKAASLLSGDVSTHVADVRARAEMAGVVDAVRAAHGGLDTVVTSAGVFGVAAMADVTDEHWDRIVDVNLRGTFVTIQAAAAELKASGRGRIVTIGSDAARRGYAYEATYVASKFGVVGLTESVAAELAPYGVTANCICPSFVPVTGMGQAVLAEKASAGLPMTAQEILESSARSTPLGRNATPADVADVALFFVSRHASFITGVSIDVDGGAHLGVTPGLK